MTTLQKTRTFLARRLEIDESEVTPERTLESLGIDSLAAIELAFEIEDEFGVRLAHGADHLRTVGDVLALVQGDLVASAS